MYWTPLNTTYPNINAIWITIILTKYKAINTAIAEKSKPRIGGIKVLTTANNGSIRIIRNIYILNKTLLLLFITPKNTSHPNMIYPIRIYPIQSIILTRRLAIAYKIISTLTTF
jgi:hypothetical protein